MNLAIETLAWIAMIAHLSGYLFQAIRTIKTKNIQGLSPLTFIVNFIGSYLWFISALLVRSFQAGIVNTFVLSALALILYIFLINHHLDRLKAQIITILLLIIVWTLTILIIIDHYLMRFIYIENDVVKLLIGIVGGIFTSSAFIPQFIKIIKHQLTRNLSYLLVGMYGLSQILWAIYWGLRSTQFSIGNWISGLIFCTLTAFLQIIIFSYKLFLELTKHHSRKVYK